MFSFCRCLDSWQYWKRRRHTLLGSVWSICNISPLQVQDPWGWFHLVHTDDICFCLGIWYKVKTMAEETKTT